MYIPFFNDPAFKQGEAARDDGKTIDENPHHPASEEFLAWRSGYEYAQACSKPFRHGPEKTP